MADKRFARVASDPRFKRVPRKHRKVKIDSRFQRMFTDKKFTTKYFVDKRGAALGKTSKEDLHQFYDLSDEEANNELTIQKQKKLVDCEPETTKSNDKKSKTKGKKLKRTIESRQSEDECQSDEENNLHHSENAIDLARGEGNIESSSDSDSGDDNDDDNDDVGESHSSAQRIHEKEQSTTEKTKSFEDSDADSDFSDQENTIDHQWSELDSNVKTNSNTSRRLAVCNLDWDKIHASDLFVLFSSLKTKGIVKSVKIYPSEFGLERLKNEECYGPEEIVEQDQAKDCDNNVEGSVFSREKLRQYQINRLKYYYAVVDCDSSKTANDIYNEYDGVEYELSGNLLDLRFIPDDMEFEHDPKSVATELPSQALYTPPEFETTALHQTNVKLTWDETDSHRLKTTMRAFNKDELQNMDFEAYLASSSDEDHEEDDNNDFDNNGNENEDESFAKYKKLVQEIDTKNSQDDKKNEMEITWEPGLKESALDLVKKKKAEKDIDKATPWEKYLNKKKEKRKEKRAKERKEKRARDEESDEDDIPESVDMLDPFFNQDFGPEFVPQKRTDKGTKHVKEKEEDKKQKDELALLVMDDNDERQHFSLKAIIENEKKTKKRKNKRKEEPGKKDTFSVNVDDPRFSALYSSHLYAIDPSDPQYKDTKAMNTILEERQRRRSKKTKESKNEDVFPTDKKTSSKDPSLSLLVNSVKTKTGEFYRRKKKPKHID